MICEQEDRSALHESGRKNRQAGQGNSGSGKSHGKFVTRPLHTTLPALPQESRKVKMSETSTHSEPHCITLEDRLRASIKRVPVVEQAEESTESYEATAALLADRMAK